MAQSDPAPGDLRVDQPLPTPIQPTPSRAGSDNARIQGKMTLFMAQSDPAP